MTPDEQERLEAYTAEIAKTLYKNTPPEALDSLESIERHLRKQWLEMVGPQVAFFLSKKQREQKKDVPAP
ncbi:hypothetical protein QUB63_18315 [Microcoleus sp. ARI1-B5]|jgi:hypothetical protein|uniref:hypothetical protein n=1 Tax=unclassified Microcoleus TaxID=2642155 RepID=UPI002FCED637